MVAHGFNPGRGKQISCTQYQSGLFSELQANQDCSLRPYLKSESGNVLDWWLKISIDVECGLFA